MKSTSRSHWVATVVVVAAIVLVAAPALLSAASEVLNQRVAVLEARVTNLEATVAALEADSPTEEDETALTATLEINLVGDSWTPTGDRTCNPDLRNVHEGAEVIVTNLQGDQVGYGVFDAGRQVNQGCIISATLSLDPSDRYYITVGAWTNFEFDVEYLEKNDWTIRLSTVG